MQLFVDQDYLNGAFEEYGISKGSTAFPDLRPFWSRHCKKSLSALRRTPSLQVQESSWTFVMAGTDPTGYLDPDCNAVDWTILSKARP